MYAYDHILQTNQMSSFELVNHQLKHIFGGIQAQKNSSLEYLEACQKKKAQVNHMKIYQALVTIKTCLRELNENYLNLEKQNKSSGGLLFKISNQINNFLQDFSEQSLSLSKKMESRVQNYAPNLKKIKQKYTECAQNLEHYRTKVGLLQKNVQKQSLANIKVDQHERYERNKEKLRKAEKEHDQMLIKTTKRFVEFNSEGMKDVYNDFISISANLAGNIMQVSNNLAKHLIEHFAAHQNLITKQTKIPRKQSDKINPSEQQGKRKKQATGDWMKSQALQYRKTFLDHLIDEKQISSYLKKVVDKEMIRQQSEMIQQIFKSRKAISMLEQNQNQQAAFNQFKNIYNNHQLKSHHLLEKVKEEDPIQACEDLLQIDEPIEMSRAVSQEIELSNDLSPERVTKEEKQDRLKNNLEKFNKICQINKMQRQKSPIGHIKPIEKAISPNLKAIQSYKTSHYASNKTVLKSPDQFFNLANFEQHKQPQNIQSKLSNLHEHAFDYDLLSSHNPKANFNKQQSTLENTNLQKINSSSDKSSIKQNSSALSFDNFDLLINEHKKNEYPKFKPSFAPAPNFNLPKQPKLNEGNNINLLNL